MRTAPLIIATFRVDGVVYRVSGCRTPRDGDGDWIRVERVDGQPIPGARWAAGMVQVGVPSDIQARAEAALSAASRRARK
jgi:hypothetical protein